MEQNKNMADASMPSDAGGRETTVRRTGPKRYISHASVSTVIFIYIYGRPQSGCATGSLDLATNDVLHRVYYEIAPLYSVLTQSTQRRAGAIFIAYKTASALTLLARLLGSARSASPDVTRL